MGRLVDTVDSAIGFTENTEAEIYDNGDWNNTKPHIPPPPPQLGVKREYAGKKYGNKEICKQFNLGQCNQSDAAHKCSASDRIHVCDMCGNPGHCSFECNAGKGVKRKIGDTKGSGKGGGEKKTHSRPSSSRKSHPNRNTVFRSTTPRRAKG